MDAVEYFKAKGRMTKKCKGSCSSCLLSSDLNGKDISCESFEYEYPERAVKIVEDWLKEHPVKTRQSEFLKMFPNARLHNGVINICPVELGEQKEEQCESITCANCKKKFWGKEIEE